MDIQELRKCAEVYEGILDRRDLVKEDENDLLEIAKARAGLTNMEVRAFKRIMKAKHSDQLDKLDEQTEAQSYLRDVLTDKTFGDKKIVAIEHAPEAQLEERRNSTADVVGSSPTRGAIKSEEGPRSPHTVSVQSVVNDAGLTPNDIIGNDPIPAFLDRR